MKQNKIVLTLALLLATLSSPKPGHAQSPTAIQKLELSAFAGATPVFTGLNGGKNFSLTVGGDLALPPVVGVRPVLEVRATQPVDHGTVDSQKDILGGLRVNFLLNRRIHPYGDFLFGRGQMNYGTFGYYYQNYVYQVTTTYVYSPGGGFDYDLFNNFGVKVDAQYQRWSGAPAPSGTIYSTNATVGLVYRFNFNRR